jgi:hypothetical protein
MGNARLSVHVMKDAGHGFGGSQNFDLVRDFFARHLHPAGPG